MPYVVTDGGKSWRWVESKDVKGGDVTSDDTPSPPAEAPKSPIPDVGELVRILVDKGVISVADIVAEKAK